MSRYAIKNKRTGGTTILTMQEIPDHLMEVYGYPRGVAHSFAYTLQKRGVFMTNRFIANWHDDNPT